MSQLTSISIEGCSKTFADGTQALNPIHLEIAGGETLVLLGPSGCGKTTLLRIIAGLEQPDPGGRVIFNGDDVTDLPIEKRNVGMVFQSYALFPNMTVAENVGYGLKVRKEKPAAIKERVDEMLQMMQIEELKDRRIEQLSGGQRQRVALARAIAVRPRVLLLDEPLTALDALLRDHLRMEIDSLLRRLNITAIYVTHDQAEAMALGDRIVVMSKGEISQIGSPREIYHQPKTDFVASFIGTMNSLPEKNIYCRPEDVELLSSSEGADYVGKVTSSFFLGDRTRLVLDGIGSGDFIVEAALREEIADGTEIPVRIPKGKRIQLDTQIMDKGTL
ncbi:ATP-binding cassette domain-containing protein [Sneathiella sp. P13V-1]|uniref:ABC transporter ATP-binding protein n=1 Tax=Sneathiella sp. P13V-1 TaxID=2697366 RepID=UPI00187BB4FD|nr:ABC transporter ATP-binding protein [Sneathiella sp. P13V-1]MBE7636560.1 ATP-binding cassette domain-containing protein [Sneathiella sp. P13V-1]